MDLEVLRRNFEQAVLDLHEAVDWLRGHAHGPTRSDLSPGNVSGRHRRRHRLQESIQDEFLATRSSELEEISLSVIDRYRHEYKGDPVSIRWTSAQHSLSEIRFHLAPIDPMVWAHRVQASSFLYIGSKDDQLVTWENSVSGFLSQLNSRIRVKKVRPDFA